MSEDDASPAARYADPMPDLILRRKITVAAYPDEFRVILTMDDGFELDVGGVRKEIGVGMREFWAWSSPGHRGQANSRDEAMAAIQASWSATESDLVESRRDQERTANKYALWDAGYRSQVANGNVRCPCGESFDPKYHEQTMAHIEHITGRRAGT